jgi:hypothetical protein
MLPRLQNNSAMFNSAFRAEWLAPRAFRLENVTISSLTEGQSALNVQPSHPFGAMADFESP